MAEKGKEINEKKEINLPSQIANIQELKQIKFDDKLFVGIDFGTSTTIVSYFQNKDDYKTLGSFDLPQPTDTDEFIYDHRINSVLAWTGGKLLFGKYAYLLKEDLSEGVDVFSSFKMRLGIDIGPTYPKTVLSRFAGLPYVIENAKDASKVFFECIRNAIKLEVKERRLPKKLYFCVSVPAAFEANQRQELLNVIKDAGFPVSESSLIDEPNAAFLSYYYYKSAHDKDPNFENLFPKDRPANILVYDFGAGTCDISILEIRHKEESFFTSTNKAISRFTALGGDNIDMAIARDVLLSQLLKSDSKYEPSYTEIEEQLVPKLMPAAERLKINAVEHIMKKGITSLDKLSKMKDDVFQTYGVKAFEIRSNILELKSPKLNLKEFGDVLRPFLTSVPGVVISNNVISPVEEALNKANLDKKDISAVLFIGGSSLNPLVRKAVGDYLHYSKALTPFDLQRHVSLGASIQSLFYHMFKVDIIKPITPESIFIITKNGREVIVPTSSPVPSSDDFKTILKVSRDGQLLVELPVCVGNEQKLLGVVKIEAPTPLGFNMDDDIKVNAGITREKLLKLEVTINKQKIKANLMNPLANKPLTILERRLLLAKQKFNTAMLEHNCNPPLDVILDYAEAAKNIGAFEIAVDMYLTADRFDPSSYNATQITYCYSHSGNNKQSEKWGKIAYEREKNVTTCFNMAISAKGDSQIYLLRESLKYDEDFTYPLYLLGKRLYKENINKIEGKALFNRFINITYRESSDCSHRRIDDLEHLEDIARVLGNKELEEWAKNELSKIKRLRSMSIDPDGRSPYDEENMAKSTQGSFVIPMSGPK